MSENLWPDLSDAETVRSPRAYLNDQAEELSGMTNGLLEGKTELEKTGGGFSVHLQVIVPNLNRYRYTVLLAHYDPVLLYPAILEDLANEVEHECLDQEQFVATLREVLSSDVVRRVLLALLSQAREAEEEIPF
jgi:hypothetical protein